jgi:hypothetical protein
MHFVKYLIIFAAALKIIKENVTMCFLVNSKDNLYVKFM